MRAVLTGTLLVTVLLAGPLLAGTPSRDQLAGADYEQGRTAFQQRCSACHTVADGGSNLVGPNLWGVIGRAAGTSPGFTSSEALKKAGFEWDIGHVWDFLAGPEQLVKGTRMMIPEPVPESERTALMSYLWLETGAADWPRPAIADRKGPVDRSKPLSERFPSFYNHLMSNTTRYRMETPAGETRFDVYFQGNGSISASVPSIRGFWNTVDRHGMEFFCYALDGIPTRPSQLVECFPIAAMAIPRFAEQLWTSKPAEGVILHGGIIAGRPPVASRP
ncbi:MAG: c-type cytochrome [Gammaproteobacteria bacterium]